MQRTGFVPKNLRNEKGMAIIETVPLLVIFVVLMSFGLGFFGVVHTATLNSIGARTYAFETFRNRTNLNYFREDQSGLQAATSLNNSRKGWRYHAVQNEGYRINRIIPTTRPISLGRGVAAINTSQEVHNQQIFQILPRNERISVNPVWVMVGYGICLSATCGN